MRGQGRRQFLKTVTTLGGVGAISTVLPLSTVLANTSRSGNGVNIVLVNLLGGLDGLAAFPYYEGPLVDTSAQIRPSLAVDPASALSIAAQNGIPNKIGLHPAFAPLVGVAGGSMAIVQGYGVGRDLGRSHDTLQVAMSLGREDVNDPEMRGFLARLMDHKGWESKQYFAFDASNPSDVNTLKQAPVRLSNLDNFTHGRTWWEDSAQANLAADLKSQLLRLQGETTQLASSFQRESRLMFETVDLFQEYLLPQQVGGNSVGDYEDTWGFPRQIRDVAKVIKAKSSGAVPSLVGKDQIFYLSHTGYDTHSDQANSQFVEKSLTARLEELAHNLAVFWQDIKLMGAEARTLVVLYSEFGRTNFQNAPANFMSAGTDHGLGSNTLIFGAGITPKVVGEPPLVGELLDEWTNALPVRIDYRDIFAEIFEELLGVDPHILFPDPGYTRNPLGIL